jgi:cardiolipin synthase (CMP-forming)
MNVPNLITIARILLVPLTVWLIISGEYMLAFGAFVAAGISDGVDGFIAKRFNQRTELGAYLDPIADKALLVSVYVSLGMLKFLPAWLVILVVTRDVLIVGAVMLAWVLDKPMRVAPSIASKVNTAGQIILIIVVLGLLSVDAMPQDTLLAGYICVGILTFGSGALYMWAWLKHMANASTGENLK